MEFNNPLTLFQHLLSIDEDKTLENLNSLIKEDHSFYLEAKELIAAHKKNKENTVFNELINDKATILVNDDSIHKLEGKQVGYYKLTKKLGQGGMGAVYLGERNDGQIEQKVAIKFVYPSIVSLAGEDFLQKEAQHLANLEHTNIAKIYTIDITEDDIPYMVMEFVDGVTIDKYFKYKKLNLKTRLKTFQKVCNAVHNAHQNMVIHADIKPSNILIDNQGEPKLMDFGISRSLSDTKELKIKSGELSLNAASRNFSSPEQVSGEELSISTDVFSLGKLLSSLCKESNFKDLNYVINRCIQPKITERYNSVAQIEDDIKNLLNNQPISLRKNENLYILSKLFSRHYVSSTIAITFFITIVFGSVMLSINNTRLAKEVVRSNQLSSFLKELISAGDPIFSQGEELKVKDLIIDGANKISTQLGDNIEDKVLLTNLLARSLINLGSYKDSIAILSNLSFKADTSPIYIAETKLNLAVALKLQSELEPALKNLLEAKEILESYKETD
ncbi:MAG: serine/threonine protein kinase, partial [Francisellaceae bacterium]